MSLMLGESTMSNVFISVCLACLFVCQWCVHLVYVCDVFANVGGVCGYNQRCVCGYLGMWVWLCEYMWTSVYM